MRRKRVSSSLQYLQVCRANRAWVECAGSVLRAVVSISQGPGLGGRGLCAVFLEGGNRRVLDKAEPGKHRGGGARGQLLQSYRRVGNVRLYSVDVYIYTGQCYRESQFRERPVGQGYQCRIKNDLKQGLTVSPESKGFWRSATPGIRRLNPV